MADRRRKAGVNGKLQSQLEKLASGEWVEPCVAREALGLDANPDLDQVVASLHRALHVWETDCCDGADSRLRRAVHAASVLVREV